MGWVLAKIGIVMALENQSDVSYEPSYYVCDHL